MECGTLGSRRITLFSDSVIDILKRSKLGDKLNVA